MPVKFQIPSDFERNLRTYSSSKAEPIHMAKAHREPRIQHKQSVSKMISGGDVREPIIQHRKKPDYVPMSQDDHIQREPEIQYRRKPDSVPQSGNVAFEEPAIQKKKRVEMTRISDSSANADRGRLLIEPDIQSRKKPGMDPHQTADSVADLLTSKKNGSSVNEYMLLGNQTKFTNNVVYRFRSKSNPGRAVDKSYEDIFPVNPSNAAEEPPARPNTSHGGRPALDHQQRSNGHDINYRNAPERLYDGAMQDGRAKTHEAGGYGNRNDRAMNNSEPRASAQNRAADDGVLTREQQLSRYYEAQSLDELARYRQQQKYRDRSKSPPRGLDRNQNDGRGRSSRHGGVDVAGTGGSAYHRSGDEKNEMNTRDKPAAPRVVVDTGKPKESYVSNYVDAAVQVTARESTSHRGDGPRNGVGNNGAVVSNGNGVNSRSVDSTEKPPEVNGKARSDLSANNAPHAGSSNNRQLQSKETTRKLLSESKKQPEKNNANSKSSNVLKEKSNNQQKPVVGSKAASSQVERQKAVQPRGMEENWNENRIRERNTDRKLENDQARKQLIHNVNERGKVGTTASRAQPIRTEQQKHRTENIRGGNVKVNRITREELVKDGQHHLAGRPKGIMKINEDYRRKKQPGAPQESGYMDVVREVQSEMANKDQNERTSALLEEQRDDDYALKYKAGVIPKSRSGPSKRGSEYQRQFQWKPTPKAVPLVASEEMVYKSHPELFLGTDSHFHGDSEYRSKFRGLTPVSARDGHHDDDHVQDDFSQPRIQRSRSLKELKFAEPDHTEAAVEASRRSFDTSDLSHADNEHRRRRRYRSEYSSNYRPPSVGSREDRGNGRRPLQNESHERHGEHISKQLSVPDRTDDVDWFSEVIALRRSAEEYRRRAQGSHFSRDHLAQLYAKNAQLWENSLENGANLSGESDELPTSARSDRGQQRSRAAMDRDDRKSQAVEIMSAREEPREREERRIELESMREIPGTRPREERQQSSREERLVSSRRSGDIQTARKQHFSSDLNERPDNSKVVPDVQTTGRRKNDVSNQKNKTVKENINPVRREQVRDIKKPQISESRHQRPSATTDRAAIDSIYRREDDQRISHHTAPLVLPSERRLEPTPPLPATGHPVTAGSGGRVDELDLTDDEEGYQTSDREDWRARPLSTAERGTITSPTIGVSYTNVPNTTRAQASNHHQGLERSAHYSTTAPSALRLPSPDYIEAERSSARRGNDRFYDEVEPSDDDDVRYVSSVNREREADKARTHHLDTSDDLQPSSARSLASSCSLANEILARARSRRNEFWTRP